MRHLYFDDTLEILHDRIRYDSLHLIYYTPPFYSKRDYNFLFGSPKGHVSLRPKGSRLRVPGGPLMALSGF